MFTEEQRAKFRQRFAAYKNGKKPYDAGRPVQEEDVGLPRYRSGKGDGFRYIPDEKGGWDRITDSETADVFANLEVTPSKTREVRVVLRKNPYYDRVKEKIHSIGYVTDEMLETDQRMRLLERMRNNHAELPLRSVYPEFDMLTLGSGLRANKLTQNLWKQRDLASEMKKVFDEGLTGATKDMPVVNPKDLYNPEHFRSAIKYNSKQIGDFRIRPFENKDMSVDTNTSLITNNNVKTKNIHPLRQRKFLSENPENKYVDSDGNVNMRNVVLAVRYFYKKHPEAKSYKDIFNSSGNLYQHIRDVVKSAQQAPIPKGSTRQELVKAALFHDIGKTLNSESSHGITSVDILKELGISTNEQIDHAIRRHMSHHLGDEDPLTKALHFVDVVRNTMPMSNTGAFDVYRNLLYKINKPYKIKPLYTWDTDWLLKNIINPILDKYGYEQIPLGLSKEEARKEVLSRAQEHRRFIRGLHTFNARNLENAIHQFEKREGRTPNEEELFDLGFEYYKEHGTSSGDRGAEEYMRKFELPYEKYMSLYTSNSDEVYRSYLRDTTDGYSGRAIELPVQDNPEWSLAELWGYNDYPLVYSPGGHNVSWNSNWRYEELPMILNNGVESLNTFAMPHKILETNQQLELQAVADAVEKAKEAVRQMIGDKKFNLSKKVPKYSDTEPSAFLLAESYPELVEDSNGKRHFFEPLLRRYFGKSALGRITAPLSFRTKTLSDQIIELNLYLKENGILEIIPYSYSEVNFPIQNSILSGERPKTIIKYPRALEELLLNISKIKQQESEIPVQIPLLRKRDGNPADRKFLFRGMTPKQITAHNKANKIRTTKDGLVVNTPIPTGESDFYGKPVYLATNTKYVPTLKSAIKNAVNLYFKDIKMARSKDSFVRKKQLENKIEAFIDENSRSLAEQFYELPKLIPLLLVPEELEYPFTTESLDGFRVFVTEHSNGPGSGRQNNYILVGPRGAKAANINRNIKLDINNHGYTRGHDNIGRLKNGLTKNAL